LAYDYDYRKDSQITLHLNVPFFPAWTTFWKEDLRYNQIDPKHLLPTIVTLHSRGILSKYDPQWFASPPTSSAVTPEEKSSTSPARRKPALPPKPKKRTEPDPEVPHISEETLELERVSVEVEELYAAIEKVRS